MDAPETSSAPPARDNAALVSVVLLFALAFGSAAVPAPFGSPKLTFFAAFAVYAAIVAFVPSLRASARAWFRVGRLDGRSLLATGAVSVLSTTALVVYTLLLHPDTSDLRAQLPATTSTTLLLAFGVTLSIVNAVSEEVVYRGVLLNHLFSARSRVRP